MGETTDPSTHNSLSGNTLGNKYLLGRMLGRGGMGEVYEATNTYTGRRVAIKTMHGHLVRNARIQQRFIAEARAATAIEHENVVQVLDLEVDSALGIPYIVQEFLVGETLEHMLSRAPMNRLTVEQALAVAVPVMGALVAAHRRNIVHRDLKPENIFIERKHGRDTPKVIDFGIAKVATPGVSDTKTGVMLGTPTYMSPEQAAGLTSELNAQTDVWSMGVVVYEMLTARVPYEAQTLEMTLGMIQYKEPVSLRERSESIGVSLPDALVAAVDRALTRDRAVRWPTMASFLEALLECGEWQQSVPSTSPPEVPTPTTPSVPPPAAERATLPEGQRGTHAEENKPRRLTVAIGIVALAAIVAVGLVYARTTPRTASTPASASQRRIVNPVPAPPAAPPPTSPPEPHAPAPSPAEEPVVARPPDPEVSAPRRRGVVRGPLRRPVVDERAAPSSATEVAPTTPEAPRGPQIIRQRGSW